VFDQNGQQPTQKSVPANAQTGFQLLLIVVFTSHGTGKCAHKTTQHRTQHRHHLIAQPGPQQATNECHDHARFGSTLPGRIKRAHQKLDGLTQQGNAQQNKKQLPADGIKAGDQGMDQSQPDDDEISAKPQINK